jgi:prevent-host-death family protein
MSTASNIPSVGVRELRQDASAILRRVKAGEVVEVTEHGNPIARLVPIGNSAYESALMTQLIKPAKNPGALNSIKPIKLKGGISATEVLLQMRREER